jgi:hypothetical protein
MLNDSEKSIRHQKSVLMNYFKNLLLKKQKQIKKYIYPFTYSWITLLLVIL